MVAFKNALIVATLAGYAFGAPVLVARQGAGVGQGCNAILTDADTASGQVVKQGGAFIAKKLGGGALGRRQGAGVGAGCDSIFTDTDTASGQVVKQAGAAIAKQLKGGKGKAAGPGPKRDLDARQLDKMGAGAGYIVGALPGGSDAGQEITDETSTVDGNGTSGSADLGEAVGEGELDAGNALTETLFGTTDGDSNTGSSAGPPPPPPHHQRDVEARQLDKAGAGIGYVVGALPGGQKAGQEITSSTGTIDGDGTTGSAKLGESIGEGELNAGNAITKAIFGTTDNSGSAGSSGAPAKKAAPKGGKGPGAGPKKGP